MSKARGFVLILAGVAFSAYVLQPDRDASTPEPPHVIDVAKTLPASSTSGAGQIAVVPEPRPAVRPALPPAPAAVAPMPTFSAPIVVTLAQRPSEPAVAPAPKAAPILRDRDAIGRELQKELKRVGCYEGELNGAWTTPTRQAMKAFTDRVNATLPTDEPDSILLTLVQAYQDRVCGKPCPAGQGLADGGRCVPNAILARATTKRSAPVAAVAAPAVEKPAPAITGWSTTTTAAAPTPPPGVAPTEGRMALAGPATPGASAPVTAPPGTQPPAATPPPTKEKKPRVGSSDGTWARNLFKRQESFN